MKKSNKPLESEFNNKNILSIGNKEIQYLKKKSILSPKNRYRICLHNNTNHLTQEMVICINGFSYIRRHKHPKNISESYHLIEGALDVYILDNSGKIINKVKLRSKNKNFRKNDSYMYRLSGPLFHFTVPTSRWTVYHEVTTGPFTKRKTVEYAKFSPDENASLDEINKFLSKYKIKNYEK